MTNRAVPLAVAALLVVACGADDSDDDTGSPPGDTQDTALFDPYAEGFVGDATTGGERFVVRCAACHAEDGSGGLGPNLATRVPDFDDLALYRVITLGSGRMPKVAVEVQEGVDIVAFLQAEFGAR